MNEIDWLPIGIAIGWSLLHFLWQGALIAAIHAAVRLAMPDASPRRRILVGYCSLLAMALAPLATLALLWPSAAAPVIAGGAAIAAAADPAPLSIAVPGAVAAEGQALPLPALLAALWAVCILLIGARTALTWWRVRRMVASAAAAPAHWQQRLTQLRVGIAVRVEVALRISGEVMTPIVVGWLRPIIVMPAAIMARLPAEQLELLIAHELAHVRRLDYLANLLQLALETLLFYHPAVHWISRQVRDDRELCCDDIVTSVLGGKRIGYARALLALAELRAKVPRPVLAAAGGALLPRVERIVGADHECPHRGRARSPAPVAVVAAVLCVGVGTQMATALHDRPALQPLPLPELMRLGAAAGVPLSWSSFEPALPAPRRAPLELAETPPAPAPVEARPLPEPQLPPLRRSRAPVLPGSPVLAAAPPVGGMQGLDRALPAAPATAAMAEVSSGTGSAAFVTGFANSRREIQAALSDGALAALDAGEKQKVDAALARMDALLTAVDDIAQLSPEQRVRLINDQELVNTVLTDASEQDRLVCRREMRTGTHFRGTSCQTVAERAALRDHSQQVFRALSKHESVM